MKNQLGNSVESSLVRIKGLDTKIVDFLLKKG